MRITLLLFSCFIFSAINSQVAAYDAARYPVIPRPFKLLPFSGEFELSNKTILVCDKKILRSDAEFFRRQVKTAYGIDLQFGTRESKGGNVIFLSPDSAGIPPEGYLLFINRQEISLYGTRAGIFYGLQTVFQLINRKVPDQEREQYDIPKHTIPSCSIVDHPAFAWRGMHLDVSRHFFTKEEVKMYLQWMAMYKLNTFHWHLTDDQGWRIEIKKYPKLTEVGAVRSGTLIGHFGEFPERYDDKPYGGFYTQADVKEIIRFADSLHITIVPEIEMPGHTKALLAAYPEFGCTQETFDVARTWGVFEDVICPTEKTFSFLRDVLAEVSALFPGKYIHIGGDECPKTRWKESAFCQSLIREKQLKDEAGLQAWFTKRIVKILQDKNKQAIGWDEILEGGLAEGAAVMSWRGEDGGVAAAKAKHNVVMSPTGYCYFDYYQSQTNDEPLAIGGYLPVEKVYSYDPVPDGLTAEAESYILGVQANLWTEYIEDFAKLQYMLFPRVCALSEVAWSLQEENEFGFFANRLAQHFDLLDRLKINYAKSIFEVRGTVKPTLLDALGLKLETYDQTATIKYSFGAETFDRVYDPNFPVLVNQSLDVYAASFKDGKKLSKTMHWYFDYNMATGKPISLLFRPNPNYADGGPLKLVDGQSGFLPWKGSEWLGWWGDTMHATIDLGRDTIVKSITATFLEDMGSWVYKPGYFDILVSNDGINFTAAPKHAAITNTTTMKNSNIMIVERGINFLESPCRTRYIRVIASSPEKIPDGNPGAGNPSWLFVSEIQVR
jgi:hexosaminidase